MTLRPTAARRLRPLHVGSEARRSGPLPDRPLCIDSSPHDDDHFEPSSCSSSAEATGERRSMKKADQAKLKRELIALKTRGDPDLDQIAMATRAQTIRRDRVAAKKLEPLLAKTFDVEKIDRVMAQRQPERTNIGKKRPAEIGKVQAALAQVFRRGGDNRRMALEILATAGLPRTSTSIAL